MGASKDARDDILTQVSTTLGATFSEHPRAYLIETLPATQLDKRYSVIWDEGVEDEALRVGTLVITRPFVLTVTYRTFSAGTDNKTKTVEGTVLDNEESLVSALRNFEFTTAQGRARSLLSATIETFDADTDAILRNTIRMNAFYCVS